MITHDITDYTLRKPKRPAVQIAHATRMTSKKTKKTAVAFLRVCQLHQMTHILKGINTETISNNGLFACKLSGRIDLFCIAIL